MNYQSPKLPGIRTPEPGPLYPNRLVEYIYNDKPYKKFGLNFAPNPEFENRPVCRIDRTDIFHVLMRLPTMFRVAEDLEHKEKARDMADAIRECGPEVVEALLEVPAFREALSAAKPTPRRRRKLNPTPEPTESTELVQDA